ncbi:cell division protein FtsL [Alkaliphilus sp. MSJ-5]|uniref:Cell division protein FtsL n=1 Tax=Alkaliphilus flagellatus TaxID=2841507 RepID=A0ABS6G475_9FIRM|nr:cell division protein FtsL [Alkaliphilus flagellatus]MBU5677289.1 cell division protein FtsL [Alkaliphilus flagellatus]
MVLARKESAYIHEQVEEKQQSKTRKSKKLKKNYKFEKFVIAIALATVFAFSILLLTRFMAITEVKHRVNSLQNQIEKLEIEKEKLRVEVEKVSKSGWIESEAKTRLGMDYPSSDQMIYININPTKVTMLTSEINKAKDGNFDQQEENKNLSSFFSRLVSYIRI